jgi:hypothetical protein
MTMPIRKLEPTEWKVFFDTYSRNVLMSDRPEYADLRLLSGTLGNLEGTSWLPLRGITWDPGNEILEIILEDLDHLVARPSEIYVEQDGDGAIRSMEIVEKDGTKQILEMR